MFRFIAISAAALSVAFAQSDREWSDGRFHWRTGPPLFDIGKGSSEDDPHVAFKDPSVVFHEGRWHVFGTLRMKSGRVCMQYLNFTDWSHAANAPRELMSFTESYHCAPQVFYFAPHRRWYLIYQLSDPSRRSGMAPYFSTTSDIANPKSWTKPEAMIPNPPPQQRWIDFWVICDSEKAHLFYTSNDGHLWRRETKLSDFPLGWSDQKLALKADIFEASHTYKLKGEDRYLTIIEAQAPGRRYYKAYEATRLDGPWAALADSLAKPFAAIENVTQSPEWTASISHGELLRSDVDERMEIDPKHLRFLFQGVSESDYRGAKYGGIPWKIGLLEQTH